MKRFEYKEFNISRSSSPPTQQLTSLGHDGWEIISIDYTSSNIFGVAKREIAEQVVLNEQFETADGNFWAEYNTSCFHTEGKK